MFVSYYGTVDVICEPNRSFLFSLLLYDFTVFICFSYSEEPSYLSYYGIYP